MVILTWTAVYIARLLSSALSNSFFGATFFSFCLQSIISSSPSVFLQPTVSFDWVPSDCLWYFYRYPKTPFAPEALRYYAISSFSSHPHSAFYGATGFCSNFFPKSFVLYSMWFKFCFFPHKSYPSSFLYN